MTLTPARRWRWMISLSRTTSRLFYFPSLTSAESGLLSQTRQRRVPFLLVLERKKLSLFESLLQLKGLQISKKTHVLTLFCLPHLYRRQLCDFSCRQHRWNAALSPESYTYQISGGDGKDVCFWPARREPSPPNLLAKSGIHWDSLNHICNVHGKVLLPVDLTR